MGNFSPAGVLEFCLMGEGSLLIQCAELVIERGHAVRGIVSIDPTILDWATSQGIPTRETSGDVSGFLRPVLRRRIRWKRVQTPNPGLS